MSDYRFGIMDWHGIKSLHVMIDTPSSEMAETHIPLDDIKITAFRGEFQAILDIMEKAQNDINKSTESDWSGIFSNAFDDIATICQAQLDKGK